MDEEIAALKAEIEGYKLELKDATSREYKLIWAGLIKSCRDNLTELEKRKNAQSVTRFKLGDGLPELVQNLTMSPPSVPAEIEHASCERIVMDFPFRTAEDVIISSAINTIWMEARTRQGDGVHFLVYSSVDDIVYFVRGFMRDILFALTLPLSFNAEVTIKQIRRDLCVLIMDKYLVGVVEVKKPGGNVLLQPTVLGELLDQMLLVEGFYGMGPVIGILTTAEEWLLAWFPVDTASLENCDITTSKDSYLTPSKPTSSVEALGSMRDSPPGGTPSQKSGTLHCIENVEDIPVGIGDDNNEIGQHMERVLCTTEVVNIHTDPSRVLHFLCSAFQLMAMSRTHHRAGLSRCLLKFHKGISAVTFHPAAYEDILPMVDFDKYPAKNVKNLVALEDLGRGSTGKAWLCVTVTRPRSAACVLKFDNKEAKSERLVHEREMWSLLYPEFSFLIRLEQ